MSLVIYKWIAAGVILLLSLVTGFSSLRLLNRYQRALALFDALANGVFIGVALFHLLPSAIRIFKLSGITHSLLLSLVIALIAYIALVSLQRLLIQPKNDSKKTSDIYLLSITLSLHALIAGLVLGLSDNYELVSLILIAILIHKGFEVFAFVVNLHKQAHPRLKIILLCLFSLVTPIGILLGTLSVHYMQAAVNHIVTAIFSAIAVGSFFYISLVHTTTSDHTTSARHGYLRVLVTIVGMLIIGGLSLAI